MKCLRAEAMRGMDGAGALIGERGQMMLMNRLNRMVRTIGDLANVAMEAEKFVGKKDGEPAVRQENDIVDEQFMKIGQFYYNVYLSGGEVAPEVQEACEIITEQLEAERAAQEEAERARREAQGTTCPACGTQNEAGVKFCRECGAKLTAEQTAERLCPQCGAAVREGKKFCTECGCKMEE